MYHISTKTQAIGSGPERNRGDKGLGVTEQLLEIIDNTTGEINSKMARFDMEFFSVVPGHDDNIIVPLVCLQNRHQFFDFTVFFGVEPDNQSAVDVIAQV
jgi:hypothetical protein